MGDIVMDVSEGAAFSFLQVIQVYVLGFVKTCFLFQTPVAMKLGHFVKHK